MDDLSFSWHLSRLHKSTYYYNYFGYLALAIANKEAFETHYWLRLLRDSILLEEKLANSLIADCAELEKLLVSSIKTAKIKN
ncbi:hypothetical protein BH24ACI1_BH24ACI1_24010 [soil metagenome]